jgi:hypothetical protein
MGALESGDGFLQSSGAGEIVDRTLYIQPLGGKIVIGGLGRDTTTTKIIGNAELGEHLKVGRSISFTTVYSGPNTISAASNNGFLVQALGVEFRDRDDYSKLYYSFSSSAFTSEITNSSLGTASTPWVQAHINTLFIGGKNLTTLLGEKFNSSDFASTELSSNVTTITKTLTVIKDWMDTGIDGDDLTTGTYIIQVSCANDSAGFYDCYWSGIMSWWKGRTNDSDTDEIILHRAGRCYTNTIYLRTVMRSNTDVNGLKLQIAANKNIGVSCTYTFKFKKVM